MMQPDQSSIHIVSANLGRWLGSELPKAAVDAARATLTTHVSSGRLRGAWVMAFGEDLHLHVTTFNGDFLAGGDASEFAAEATLAAALAALSKGFEMGLGSATTVGAKAGARFAPAPTAFRSAMLSTMATKSLPSIRWPEPLSGLKYRLNSARLKKPQLAFRALATKIGSAPRSVNG